MHNSFFFRQNLNKLLAITNSFPSIRVLFVSNYNLIYSESSEIFDFSGYIILNFPILDDTSIREILNKNHIDYNSYTDIIKKSLGSYSSNIVNLNELIYNIRSLIEIKKKSQEKECQEKNEDFSNISIAPIVEKFKLEKGVDFITRDMNSEETEKLIQDCVNLKENKKNPDQFRIGEFLKLQINQGGVHFDNFNGGRLDSISDTINSQKFSRNLTESLSETQKLLLLSSFMATSSSAKVDSVTFKVVKKTKNRIIKVIKLTIFF
jgi:hypothetical protein